MQAGLDPQTQLNNALTSRSIHEFRLALDLGADPLLAADEQQECVFETALKTYGFADFVSECLEHGCLSSYQNPRTKKAAINFAAESADPNILKTLLNYKGVVVDYKYEEVSPLNTLAQNLTNQNFNDILACIKMLLQHGASPNLPDQHEKTPLHYIKENRQIDGVRRQQLIKLIAETTNMADNDSTTSSSSSPEAEPTFFLASRFAMALEDNADDMDIATRLLHLLHTNSEEFRSLLKLYLNSGEITKEKCIPLLTESIKFSKNEIFDILMQHDVVDGNNALNLALEYGNPYALRELLLLPNIEFGPNDYPLIGIVRRLNECSSLQFCDYRKCFYVLLASNKVNINAADANKSTALHYALRYGNEKIIRELLKKGAYLGIQNDFKEYPINGMNPELLEQHFNDCITTNNLNLGDKKFEIFVNYMNVIPPRGKQKYLNHRPARVVEMNAIKSIAESKECNHLLQHPLISSLIFVKWHKLSMIFYINFLFYIFFAVSNIALAALKFHDTHHPSLTHALVMCSRVGIGYMILREFLQFVVYPWHYITSLTNYRELTLIVLAISTCSETSFEQDIQKDIAVTAILLIAWELCHLVGSLPVKAISTHMLMLEAVCKSFIKSFAFYSIFVATFGLCFYILFAKISEGEQQQQQLNINKTSTTADEGDFNNFANPLAVLLRVIIMLTGELEASNVEFNSMFSYVFFLIFVIFMTIVLFNLLNGLAVSDTQLILSQAQLNGIICRINLLARYEKLIAVHSGNFTSLFKLKPLRFLMRLLNLQPIFLGGRNISIMPNDGNRFFIVLKNFHEFEEARYMTGSTSFVPLKNKYDENETILLQPTRICAGMIESNSQMDHSTVNAAMAIIGKAYRERNERSEHGRNENLEHKLDTIKLRIESLEMKLQRSLEIMEKLPEKLLRVEQI